MKHRLLLANPDMKWRDLNQKFLAELGYEVETCTDGLDCLEKLRHAKPAMMVLDLDLPWGGGDGVLAWLREENPESDVPVLLMGPAAASAARECINELPVVEYLPKPVGLIRLLESIRSAFLSTNRSDPSNQSRDPRTKNDSTEDMGSRR